MLLAVLVAGSLVGGCDNTLNPIPEDTVYTLHGALNVTKDWQVIRVRNLRSPVTPEGTGPLEARVQIENLATGATWQLQDSTVVFDGVTTHNYWARFDVAPDTRYKVTVSGPDGSNPATATTRTPKIKPAVALPDSGNCLDTFTITFPEIEELALIQARIGYMPDSQRVWRDLDVRFGTHNGETVPLYTFQPEELIKPDIPSQDLPSRLFYEPRCWELTENEIIVGFRHLGPAWSGEFPGQEIEFDPTQTGRVTNGLGFFGGYRMDTVAVEVDTAEAIPINRSPVARETAQR
jgi:hypothetical protein